jgi:hypothetical protein
LLLTDYQAKYIVTELTRRFPLDSAEKIAATFVDAQDDVDLQSEALIARIEGRLQQKETSGILFSIRWTLT